MKPARLCTALCLVLAAGAIQAADTPADAMPHSAQDWVRYLSDFSRNGEALADPRKFVAALAAVSEPDFMMAALEAAMDPARYLLSVASLADPRVQANYSRPMDPAVAAVWSRALADPQFYNAVAFILTDPGKLGRWLMAPLDPKVMGGVLTALNPNPAPRVATANQPPQPPAQAAAPIWPGAWAPVAAAPQYALPRFAPSQFATPQFAWPPAYPVLLTLPAYPR